MLRVALSARPPVVSCAAETRAEALPQAAAPNDSTGEARVAYLRDLRGDDELRLADSDPVLLDELLSQLLLGIPGASFGPGNLAEASVGDRDLLVAALYTQCFGDNVDLQVQCMDCGESFEVRCSLAEEMAAARDVAEESLRCEPTSGPDAQGFYRLPSGLCFRLPTVADESVLRTLSPGRRREDLLARCVRTNLAEDAGTTTASKVLTSEEIFAVERAMQARDPGASPTLTVPCALCRAPQSIELDIVELFLATVAREVPLLAREIHSLAKAYHWSLREIVSLSRWQRHAQVALVEAGHASEGALS